VRSCTSGSTSILRAGELPARSGSECAVLQIKKFTQINKKINKKLTNEKLTNEKLTKKMQKKSTKIINKKFKKKLAK
jgi:hypothetical protein